MVYVGTIGYSYNHWRGVFYPDGLPAPSFLRYYSSRFGSVELNYTFYRLPTERVCRRWHDDVPAGFKFSLKGSRFITHVRKLAVDDRDLLRFAEPLRALEGKLAVILWQLPPSLVMDREIVGRFAYALEKLGPFATCRHVFEPRHPSWFVDDFFDLLREHGYGLVSPGEGFVSPFGYWRMHNGKLPNGSYTAIELTGLAGEVAAYSHSGSEAFVYFDHHAEGYAPRNAAMFTDLLRTKTRRAGGSAA